MPESAFFQDLVNGRELDRWWNALPKQTRDRIDRYRRQMKRDTGCESPGHYIVDIGNELLGNAGPFHEPKFQAISSLQESLWRHFNSFKCIHDLQWPLENQKIIADLAWQFGRDFRYIYIRFRYALNRLGEPSSIQEWIKFLRCVIDIPPPRPVQTTKPAAPAKKEPLHPEPKDGKAYKRPNVRRPVKSAGGVQVAPQDTQPRQTVSQPRVPNSTSDHTSVVESSPSDVALSATAPLPVGSMSSPAPSSDTLIPAEQADDSATTSSSPASSAAEGHEPSKQREEHKTAEAKDAEEDTLNDTLTGSATGGPPVPSGSPSEPAGDAAPPPASPAAAEDSERSKQTEACKTAEAEIDDEDTSDETPTEPINGEASAPAASPSKPSTDVASPPASPAPPPAPAPAPGSDAPQSSGSTTLATPHNAEAVNDDEGTVNDTPTKSPVKQASTSSSSPSETTQDTAVAPTLPAPAVSPPLSSSAISESARSSESDSRDATLQETPVLKRKQASRAEENDDDDDDDDEDETRSKRQKYEPLAE